MPKTCAGGLALLVAITVIVATGGSSGALANEFIDSDKVEIDIRPDGNLRIEEVIAYQFGDRHKHGIIRHIPVRQHYDGRNDRIWRITNIQVRASADTPTELTVADQGNSKVLRIGDPKHTITGAHTYTIDYEVAGAVASFPDHDELYWNAIGAEWDVSVDRPAVVVTSPVPLAKITCFAGPFRSRSACDSAHIVQSGRAEFANRDLRPTEAMTVVVALPKATLSGTGPILEERWAVARAFTATPLILAASSALLLVGLALVGVLVRKRGRDDKLVAGDTGGRHDAESVLPDVDGPPAGIRPAMAGLLMDELVKPIHITATVVDLAVRGFLVIEDMDRPATGGSRPDASARWRPPDWNLIPKEGPDEVLVPYERELHDSLFPNYSAPIRLSALGSGFSDGVPKVEAMLYRAMVRDRWFFMRPDHARRNWLAAGITLTGMGAVAMAVLAAITHAALVATPLFIVGLAVTAVHRRMPYRTSKGNAAVLQVLRFRRHLDAATGQHLLTGEGQDKQEDVFGEFLPYAMVFSATRRWAKSFEDRKGAAAANTETWYRSPDDFRNLGSLPDSLDRFNNTTAGAMASQVRNSTSPESTSGSSTDSSGFSDGFAGGGGGGGGGESW